MHINTLKCIVNFVRVPIPARSMAKSESPREIDLEWRLEGHLVAAMRAVWNTRAPFVSVWRGDKNGIGAFEKRQLADWLSSKEGQAAIAGYTVGGEKLFHPEADPKP